MLRCHANLLAQIGHGDASNVNASNRGASAGWRHEPPEQVRQYVFARTLGPFARATASNARTSSFRSDNGGIA